MSAGGRLTGRQTGVWAGRGVTCAPSVPEQLTGGPGRGAVEDRVDRRPADGTCEVRSGVRWVGRGVVCVIVCIGAFVLGSQGNEWSVEFETIAMEVGVGQ